MELIEIIDIITAEYTEAIHDIGFDMNGYKRSIELSANKEQKIKDIIAGLNYNVCMIGMAYQANNYSLDCTKDFTNVTRAIARYYYNKQDSIEKWYKGDIATIIKEDARTFWRPYCIEVELREILSIMEKKDISNQSKCKMTINEEELKTFFTHQFKGGGNAGINYFEWLIKDLNVPMSGIYFARIAYAIYIGGKLAPAKKPNTFTQWYRTFCELTGHTYHKDYKRSKLRLDDNFKTKYNYLF